MSPPALRRYRAERLLRQEFEGLRGSVIAAARGMLRAKGVTLDQSDLDACYAQAWQGLYMALLEGQEIDSPTGWLALVTFRRAVEEHRARARTRCGNARLEREPGDSAELGWRRQGDLAAELDDRVRLRQLFEALRVRLSKRELQAATLCYLHGFSRSEAAARMGISERRMSKLMEGRGGGRPGVASKVGTLAQTIRRGDWCEEQGSLMRGFAYGIHDPAGERYQLAVRHHRQCPACRSYVLSLRGLAAALPLPPFPVALTAALAAGTRAGGVGLRAAGVGSRAGGTGVRAASAGTEAAGGGVAGAGGAGGGWLLAGAGSKLAVGCAVAVTVGAGCVALSVGPPARQRPAHGVRAAPEGSRASAVPAQPTGPALAAAPSPTTFSSTKSAQPRSPAGQTAHPPRPASTSRPSTSRPKADREFGIEQPAGGGSVPAERGSSETGPSESGAAESNQAHAATLGSQPRSHTGGKEAATAAPSSSTRVAQPGAAAAAAEREFGPG
jgi:DNA-directed RNA polymerase specialized sigma24 family protein